MSPLETLLTRRTVHEYSTAPIPEGALERAFEAALAAPNHRMTEPWRFTRVGPTTRQRLVEISLRQKLGPGTAPRPEVVNKTQRKMLDPAELVVVSRVRCDDPDVEREDYAAVACAIQNLTLALWAEGVASKWSTGQVTRESDSYTALGISEQDEEIVGFVWVGMPAKPTPKTKRRKGVADVVRSVP